MHCLPSLVSARQLLLAASAAAAIFSASVSAAETWVITDQAHPVAGDADRRILLDAPAQIEAELAAGLPPDPGRAAAVVQQRVKQGGTDLQRRLGTAYQDVADAWSLGVAKIPAVVVDRRYVVYGDTDVARAVTRIEQDRRAQP